MEHNIDDTAHLKLATKYLIRSRRLFWNVSFSEEAFPRSPFGRLPFAFRFTQRDFARGWECYFITVRVEKNTRQKLGQERRPVVASCVWLEVRPRSTSDEFPGWVIIRDNSHVKNTLLSLNQGNFTKFCVAVSFTLVDLKFLVQ